MKKLSRRVMELDKVNVPTLVQSKDLILRSDPYEMDKAEKEPLATVVAVACPSNRRPWNEDPHAEADRWTQQEIDSLKVDKRPFTLSHGRLNDDFSKWDVKPTIAGHIREARVDENGAMIMTGVLHDTMAGRTACNAIQAGHTSDVSLGVFSYDPDGSGHYVHECHHAALCPEGRLGKTSILAYKKNSGDVEDSFLNTDPGAHYQSSPTAFKESMSAVSSEMRAESRVYTPNSQSKSVQKQGFGGTPAAAKAHRIRFYTFNAWTVKSSKSSSLEKRALRRTLYIIAYVYNFTCRYTHSYIRIYLSITRSILS